MLKIKSFTFSPIQENTYVLYNENKEAIIIDPGCYDDAEKQELAAFITSEGLKPVKLINTHCHLDHIFGNKFIAETYKLIPEFHKDEQQIHDFASASGLMYNLPFDTYSGEVKYLPGQGTINLGEDVLEVLHTPGHSPGHLSFYKADQQFVISGDALFNRSIGRTDLPLGNHAQLIKSIKEKLLVLPGETVVYSGHGPKTTVGEEKSENPFLT
ncbi:MAG: MBL fold metallo-hydrolase [Ferruginibacter sp.]